MNKAKLKFHEQGERITKLRTSMEVAQNKMAEMLEIDSTRYGHYERGRSQMPTELLKEFCQIVQSNPSYIRYGEAQQAIPEIKSVGQVPIIGEVQAGIWKEAHQLEQQDWDYAPFINKKNYKNLYGLRISGDSMNMFYHEGDTVIVCPLYDFPRDVGTGKHVIVERCRGGDICEITVKELVIDVGKAKLYPRSTNPKFKDPLDLFWPYEKKQYHGIETIEIKGVVIAAHKDMDRD